MTGEPVICQPYGRAGSLAGSRGGGRQDQRALPDGAGAQARTGRPFQSVATEYPEMPSVSRTISVN